MKLSLAISSVPELFLVRLGVEGKAFIHENQLFAWSSDGRVAAWPKPCLTERRDGRAAA